MPEEREEVYQHMSEAAQQAVVEVHAKALETRKIPTLKRIFHLGNPRIVIGKRENGERYCRIHEKDADTMKLLIRNYLHRPGKPAKTN